MTDAKNQQAEPSMEEILASIRRIISEDTDGAKPQPAAGSPPPAAEAPPPPKASEPAPSKASEPAPFKASAPPPPPPSAAAPEVLELTEMVGDDGNVTELESEKPAEPVEKPAEPAPADEDERLVSQRAASAAAGALSGLQAATRRTETPRSIGGILGLGNGGATLEEIVRAEMRPILKAWLDEHLPPLVERLVQKEIKRITRQVDE